MNIHTARYFQTGRLDNIGNAAAVQLYPTSGNPLVFRQGLTIYAASGNSAVLFVGQANVTANGNANTDGFPLLPGTQFTFPLDGPSGVFLIAGGSGTNKAWWFGA